MQLRTKLVLTATGLTSAIVLVISIIFLGELTHQRIDQTEASNDILAHEVVLMTRQTVESGLRENPPRLASPDQSPADAVHAAVVAALRSSAPLSEVINAIVRYSPTVQDVTVTDAHGFTIVSTDEDMLNQQIPYRRSFSSVLNGSTVSQLQEVFGPSRVLDVSVPLERNGMPFLVVHVGVRSTFLRNAYEPFLRAAIWFALLAAIASMVAAGVLSAVAMRPLRSIGEQLERLALPPGETPPPAPLLLEVKSDPVGRVNQTIDRLGREMRSREEGYTALQANLAHVLDTLREGIVLFTAERRAVMVSDAVANFLPEPDGDPRPTAPLVGQTLDEIFPPGTALGDAVLAAFDAGRNVAAEQVLLEDGRQVQISLDHIQDQMVPDQMVPDQMVPDQIVPDGVPEQMQAQDPARDGSPNGDFSRARRMGTLLTLRDTGSALELEQELEVSRRLASIGRLTANVGHEVKNPINAMVVHLELLRSKLSSSTVEPESARRHVDILADEMRRLDRVVQTLADFSRPISLELRDQDLRPIVERVLDLSGEELRQHSVVLETSLPGQRMPVLVDSELIRQALLNLVLNAMQAMPGGGKLRVTMTRQHKFAIVEVADNGTGIPASVLPRIFDLYFTTKPTGSGIGLAMTYRILQLHGGALDVHSNAEPDSPDRGTVFTLRVPISKSAPTELRRVPSRIGDGAEPAQAGETSADTSNIATKETH